MPLPAPAPRAVPAVQSVTEEALARLFRSFPGMEYCDLKRDRATGRSKGYCYVNYSSPEAAAAAQAQFNGIDFPQGTGYRLKVGAAGADGAYFLVPV
jgi:RNA recognition motif-containing protein